MFNVYYNVPTNIPLGTACVVQDSCAYQNPMSNWLNDYSPWDNVNYFISTIVGSWDPNFIEVNPKGVGPNGTIYNKDSILDYMIHFQNLGNYKAQNIFILDTLDADLDWKTLRPIYATHDYSMHISETGVLKIEFPNIDLPPKSWGEEASMGMISYTIKRKQNAALRTQFTNQAGIYFDFNAPVQTNTTLNTLAAPSAIPGIMKESDLEIYPNPVTDYVMVKVSDIEANEHVHLTITNLSGQIVQSYYLTAAKDHEPLRLATSGLTSGFYFITVETNQLKRTGKFVKE